MHYQVCRRKPHQIDVHIFGISMLKSELNKKIKFTDLEIKKDLEITCTMHSKRLQEQLQ